MIEIPEAATISHQVTESLAGRRIVSAKAGSSPHKFAFFSGDPASYGARLTGRTLIKASAWGGIVEIETDGEFLTLRDGVNPRYLAPGAPRPAKHHLLLEFDDGAGLSCTVQMYGGMQLIVPGQADNPYYLVARDRPSPLSAAFDEDYFAGLLATAKPSLSAKAFLATEQRIPGLGNGCLHDILYLARIHPRSTLAALRDEEAALAQGSGGMASLFQSVKRTLRAMADGGGRDVEKDLYGRSGRYVCELSAKTLDRACRICNGSIVKAQYLGGTVYYCPRCQPQLS